MTSKRLPKQCFVLRTDRVVWLKQPGETVKSYAGFSAYRDMGPGRSLLKLAQALKRPPSYVGQLEIWSSQFQWVARAAAFDENEHMEAMRRAMEERERARTDTLLICKGFKNIAGQRLQGLLKDKEAVEGMTPRDTMLLFREAVTIEARMMGDNDRLELIVAPADNKDMEDTYGEPGRINEVLRILESVGAIPRAKKGDGQEANATDEQVYPDSSHP